MLRLRKYLVKVQLFMLFNEMLNKTVLPSIILGIALIIPHPDLHHPLV